MKKVLLFFVIMLMASQVFGFSARKSTTKDMYEEVQEQLGHKIEKFEQNIIDTIYLYYYKKCDWNWTEEMWETAVDKAAELCQNKVAVAAAKAGVFGEKLLQSLIVTTEDVVSGINNWLNNKSEEYKKRHP